MSEGPVSAGTLTVRIVSDAKGLGADVRKQVNDATSAAQSSMRRAGGTLTSQAKSIGGASSKYLVLGAAAAGAGFLAAGGAAVSMGVKTAASMEQAQVAFSTLLGSGQKAQAFLGTLSDFAAKTPFELPGLIDASRQLLGVGQSADSVIPTLTAFGDASGALGLNQDQFNHIMLATTQAMANGKLQAGDMLQITQAGLPVWSELSKALGLPVAKVRELSSSGKLLTADTLPKLQAQLEKDYGGSMAKQSQTLNGLWSTFMDTLHLGLGKAIQPMIPALKVGLAGASTILAKAMGGLASILPLLGRGLGFVRDVLEAFIGMLTHKAIGHSVLTNPTLSRGVMAAANGLRAAWGGLVAIVKGFLIPALKLTGQWITGVLLPAVRNLFHALTPALHTAVKLVAGALLLLGKFLVHVVGPALVAVTGFLARHRTMFQAVLVMIGTVVAIYGAYRLVQLAAAGAMAVVTIAQRLMNAAMEANPIMLVVVALVALVAGLVYAYTHSETFRKIVQAVFHAIKAVVLAVVHAVVAAITSAWRAVAAVFKFYFTLYRAIVMGVFHAIEAVIRGAVAVVRAIITTAWRVIRAVFVTYFNAYRTIVTGVFHAIQAVIRTVLGWVKAFISREVAGIKAIWSAGWHAVSSAVSAVWRTIEGVVRSGVGVVKSLVGRVVGFFKGIPGQIGAAFSGLADIIMGPFKAAFNAIAGFWNSTLGQVHFETPGWLGPLGHKGFSIPKMPTLQFGGRVVAPGLALVGEVEPEIVELPGGATVTPLSKMPQKRAGRDAGKAGATIHVHPAPGMDEVGIARMVGRELEWAAT